MGKYAPLGSFLRRQGTELVPMTFAQIEHIVGVALPRSSQQYPAWWSNNPANNVMTKVWLAAGYQTEQVDLAARRLVFRRVREAQATAASPAAAAPGEDAPANRHPLFGLMKDLMQIAAGTDLTRPADPDWNGAD